MYKQEYSDELFESLLSVALKKQLTDEINSLPSDEDLKKLFEPIPELDNRISKIISSNYRKYKFKSVAKFTVRIVVAFALFLTVSSTILLNVEASRTFIFKMLLHWRITEISLIITTV